MHLAHRSDAATWFTSGGALGDGTFQVRSIMPAAFGLPALAIAVTTGIVIRSVTGALVAGLLVAAGFVLVIAFPLRPHLLPATQDTTPIGATESPEGQVVTSRTGLDNPDTWFLGSGMLDDQGHDVSLNTVIRLCSSQEPTTDMAAANRALADCRRDHGIVTQYTNYLPGRMLWPLRAVITGICTVLAALFLALGAWQLRAAPRAGR